MRLPTDPAFYLGLRLASTILLIGSVIVAFEYGQLWLLLAGLVGGVALLAVARTVKTRSEAETPEGPRTVMFWADTALSLALVAYFAQRDVAGASLALIITGVVVGVLVVESARDAVTRTLRARRVVRLVLFLVAAAGTITYFLYATGLGWSPGWATHLLIITGVSGFIGAAITFVLLHVTGRLRRPSTGERTH